MSNPIIEELFRRAPGGENKTIEDELVELYKEIKKEAVTHLSRVKEFLPEYDDHSVNHSNAVLNYIAEIIGEEGIDNLSIYELFILAASAYLHDFGMALTGYEKKVLELAEEKPLPVSIDGIDETKKIIHDYREFIFGAQLSDALQVKLLPHKETKLIEFLSKLYQEYQTFRNGYTEEYKKIMDDGKEKDEQKRQKKLEKKNEGIRMDFIRETHPKRSAQYAQNWGSRFQEENASLSGIMGDVAKVVQSHGESFNDIKKLDRAAKYKLIRGSNNIANLQFASMMLRLGDIAHFTFDRAPVNLRREVRFNSEESRKQWMVKNDVSNLINKLENQTEIVFHAQCTTPQSYCYLEKYIGYINQEIDYFKDLKSDWEKQYQIPLVPVINEVEPLNDAFETKPDLKFTLNQNRIIDLLMGAQLYEDPYTCLRELYQNSLDACRCAIARRKSREDNPKCTIEFGVKEDEGGKYLYCLDDGKGMSKDIIEHYFLNIGSSYYKSKEFFTEWAKYNSGFTPTSQFGIGILSCFMIGERLEVLTKEHNGELITFGVDGPQETFYYWRDKNHISLTDKETIEEQDSGTLVKVYLKEQYAKEIDNGELDKLELLKCIRLNYDNLDVFNPSDSTDKDETQYVNLFKRWRRHIYKKVFDFVQLPFPEIAIQVLCANVLLPIEPRPHLAHVDLATFEKDKKYFEKYSSGSWKTNSDLAEYPIDIAHSNFVYHSMLYLPAKEDEDYSNNEYFYSGLCVDGVSIGSANDFEDDKFEYSLSGLARRGIFNFMGEHKPAVKIDRCSFVNKVHIQDPEQLFSEYLDKVISITKKHIENCHIEIGSPFYQEIWERVIDRLPKYLRTLLTNRFDRFDEKDCPRFNSESLSVFMGERNTVPELMSRKSIKVCLDRGLFRTDAFLIKKLSSIKSVTFAQDGELQLEFGELPQLPYFESEVSDYVVGLPPHDIGLYKDYDILRSVYPLVSHRLAKWLSDHETVGAGAIVGKFDSRFIERFEFGYSSSLHEEHIKFLNKEISCYRTDIRKYDFDHYLRWRFSGGFSFISLYYRMIIGGEHSVIFPRFDNANGRFIVVEGKLTRKEMDEIVGYCYKY